MRLASPRAGKARAMSTRHAPLPQPERMEPKHPDPGLATLTVRDYDAVFIRAVRRRLTTT